MQGDDITDRLEAVYSEIAVTRMEGVPILNKALSVAAVGFAPWQSYHLGVLLTPWFMNLMLVPLDQAVFAETSAKVGDKRVIDLPAGRVEFITAYEEAIGYSLSCSLFSPVFEFADQAAALDTAHAALAEVMAEGDAAPDDDADMRDIWAGRLPEPETAEPLPAAEISRRDLFRGARPVGDQP